VIPSGRTSDPVRQVISSEEIVSLVDCLTRLLSSLESQVLKYYLEGNSYEDIAAQIGHDTKTVDNALQRIKRKVTLHLESRRVVL
jgi:RNA polymerase sporulation-specific sigma factor